MIRASIAAAALAYAGADCAHSFSAAVARPADRHDAALAFDGVSGYMFASVAAPDPFTTEATLAAWVYLDELPSEAGHIFLVCGKSGFARDLDLQIEPDDRFHFYVARGAPSVVISKTVVEPKRWYRVAVTYRSDDAIAFYLDGALEAKRGIPGVARLPNVGPLSVGENFAFPGRKFNGRVDEVSFWSRVLRPEEIAALWRAPAGPAPGLVAAYPFDGDTRDRSANGLDGQLVGNARLESPGAPRSAASRVAPPIAPLAAPPARPAEPTPQAPESPPIDD